MERWIYNIAPKVFYLTFCVSTYSLFFYIKLFIKLSNFKQPNFHLFLLQKVLYSNNLKIYDRREMNELKIKAPP